jgi:phosphate transport system substrate-binding protein
MGPVLRELGDAYQALHPNVLVEVRGGDSAAGQRALAAGDADLAAVSWKSPDEKASAGVQSVPIARDAVALIVHRSNHLAGLTLLQARSIYRGEILDWGALGGPALEPLVVAREDGSGTRAAFDTLVMGGELVTLNALVMPSTRSMVDYVATHAPAIGYASMDAVTDTVRALPVEGVVPTAANTRAGAYHLTRLLYLYTASPAPPSVQGFHDFALSPAGQAIVARHHVPLR